LAPGATGEEGAAAAGALDIVPLDVDEPVDWQLSTHQINTQANTTPAAPKDLMKASSTSALARSTANERARTRSRTEMNPMVRE
jgi:hypothetical protein